MSKDLVMLDSPSQLAEFSKTLKGFIVKQKLYTKIADKNYVNVEGWQFAGISTGVVPIIKKVEKQPTSDSEINYRAEVELRKGDQVMGYGVAICSSKESKRRSADEYVIASMAQTRAIGKAYRNLFAYLMKMASFEPTPAEEMTVASSEKSIATVSNEIVAEYIKMIDGADTIFKLEQIKKKIVNCLASKIIGNEDYKQLDAKIEGRKNGLSKTG